MITVRFPNGTFATYNRANWIKWSLTPGQLSLYAGHPDKGGDWIAIVNLSGGGIVEWNSPCRVGTADKSESLRLVVENLREFSGYADLRSLRDLKAKLKKFNGRSRTWKK